MPKRKATARLSGQAGSDGADAVPVNGTDAGQRENERPAKRARGRPRSKSFESKPPAETKRNSTVAQAPAPDSAPKKASKRGRPKGSRNSAQGATQEGPERKAGGNEEIKDEVGVQEPESLAASNDELDDAPVATKSNQMAKSAKPAATRGRKKVSAGKQVQTDGEFEYTPRATRQVQLPAKPQEPLEQPKRQSRRIHWTEPSSVAAENEQEEMEVVEESVLHEEPVVPRSASASPTKGRRSSQPAPGSSPLKKKLGGSTDDDKIGEPELRRRLGDLTKKYDTLENRYRNLREIGIVEANANMDKLRQHCEAVTTASNNLVASLKAELEAQKKLGQQSRALQKQLKERDAEVATLKSQAAEAKNQLTAAQSEVKALQTKLAAARNTTASLETAAAKVPGSAIKNNRANRAAEVEAAQAAHLAQLKEELYSDLTGLVILDVKKRESDHLYDCLQTGVNGSKFHFEKGGLQDAFLTTRQLFTSNWLSQQ
jgi:predicted  nucleic acid-binding Zn-ribbon protein